MPPATILACSDGSERSLAAFPHARRLADAIGARVLAFQVITDLADETILVERALQRAATQAARTRQRLRRAAGTDADDALVAIARPGEKVHSRIIAAAREHDAALIVLGSRGANIFRDAIIGSVSQAVIQDAHVPVLLTGRHTAAPEAATSPYHIVAALEGDAPGESLAAGLGAWTAGPAVRLSSVRLARPGGEPMPDDGILDLTAPGRGGVSQAEALIAYAVGQHADAIAVARGSSLSLRHRLLRRSLATNLIDRSPLPTIIAPVT